MPTRKKIVSVRLYRFQSHIDSTIIFDDISNAIVGRTDSGKSAITRALYWTLYNKPARIGHKGKTDEFTTWGENNCFVTVSFDDGTEITRGRKREENYYILTCPDGTSTEFRGFGFEVPQDILDAHGMYPLNIDDSIISLNISQQLDPLFMLEASSSVRAKVIGKLSSADKADGGIGVINNWHRTANNTRKDNMSELEELYSKMAEFDFVDDLEAAINTLSSLLCRIDTHHTLFDAISDKYQSLLDLEVQKKKILSFMAYEDNLITLDQLINTITELKQRYESIHVVFNNFERLRKDQANLIVTLDQVDKLRNITMHLSFASSKVEQLNTITQHFQTYKALEENLAAASRLLSRAEDISDVEKAFDRLNILISTYNNIHNTYKNYSFMCERIVSGKAFIDKTETELVSAAEEYKRVLAEAAVCPYCNSSITEEQLEQISF